MRFAHARRPAGLRCLGGVLALGWLLFPLQAAATGPVTGDACVGFIWHYPFSEVGVDLILASGANVMMARCNWPAVQPEEHVFDFSSLRRQLEAAESAGVKLVLLLEFNPFCSPAWLKEKCAAADQSVMGPDGETGSMPRANSPIFDAAQRLLIRRVAEFLAADDTQGTVTHYIPGIEWWFPTNERHAPADVAEFRAWLESRYGSVEALNEAWDCEVTSFSEIPVPDLAYDGSLWEKGRQGLAPVALKFQDDGAGVRPGGRRKAAEDWTAFWNAKAAAYINGVSEVVREIDPSRPRASFLTFAWAQSAEWDYVDWSGIRLDAVAASASSLDILGMQLCFAQGDSFRLTAGLDLARKYGKPMWNLDLLDFVLGVAGGYASHERNTHAAIQHGASGLFYCCWNGAKDFNFVPDWPMDDLNRMVTGARQALALVEGMTLVTDGAIINTIVSAAPGDPAFGRNDLRSFMGWYKILERAGRTMDAVTLREIERGWTQLDPYPWVFAPDMPDVSGDARLALEDYARHGGLLIRGGRFGGLPAGSAEGPGSALPDHGLRYAEGGLPREAKAGDTPPQMRWRPETEASAQVLEAATRAFLDVEAPARRRDRPTIEPGGRDVRYARFRGAGEKLVYLVNMAPGPASGVELDLGAENVAITAIHADLLPLRVDTAYAGRRKAVLPTFRCSCLVRLKPAEHER